MDDKTTLDVLNNLPAITGNIKLSCIYSLLNLYTILFENKQVNKTDFNFENYYEENKKDIAALCLFNHILYSDSMRVLTMQFKENTQVRDTINRALLNGNLGIDEMLTEESAYDFAKTIFSLKQMIVVYLSNIGSNPYLSVEAFVRVALLQIKNTSMEEIKLVETILSEDVGHCEDARDINYDELKNTVISYLAALHEIFERIDFFNYKKSLHNLDSIMYVAEDEKLKKILGPIADEIRDSLYGDVIELN